MSKYLKKLSLILLTVLVSAPAFSAFEETEELRLIANLTTSMFSKMHYVKREISPENSSKLFDSYIKSLDPMRIFFTKEQINLWRLHERRLLPGLAATGDVSIAFGIFNEYLKILGEYEEFVKKQNFSEADFKANETFDFDRTKAEWPADKAARNELWRKKLKSDILAFMLQDKIKAEEAAKEAKEGKAKKEPVIATKPPAERVKKRIEQFVQFNQKLEPIEALEIYLNSLARLYDPHTNYMAPRSEEDFNIGMRLSLVGIGALLTNEDGYTKIVQIIPGGPADKDKRLKADDRIIAVAQENGEPVDVVDMPLTKVVSLIRGEEGTKVTLTILEGIKGAKAVPVNIVLTRTKVELKESEAKGELHTVKGPNGKDLRIGVITLPSFYLDFKAAGSGDRNYKSSTRDVKKLIEGFKKQGSLDGLIVDLRTNGGGSLQEAVSLTGLFIKTGPVVQLRDAAGRVEVYKDEDPEIAYNGPLIVMTNRLSASASEIFAGAIKDYKRGILVGDQKTHGKGSVQTVADLGHYLPYLGYNFPAGSIKLTNAKFYRVNGASTQMKGVSPDIAFPTFTDTMETGEDKLENAMEWDSITPAKHPLCDPTLSVTAAHLKAKSDARVNASKDFSALKRDIAYLMKNKDKKTISLNFDQRWKEYLREKDIYEEQSKLLHLESRTEDQKNRKKDLYLDETLNIMCDYITEKTSPQKPVLAGGKK